MKTIIFILLVTLANTSNAQISKIDIQASGLTCSMCNKSIFKSLSTIKNIEKIDSDLNTNTFSVYFKDNTIINIDELKNKVVTAGYKVANLWLYVQVTDVQIVKDAHIDINKTTFHFIDVKEQKLDGEHKVRIIDKGFVTSNEYKAFAKKTTMKCYQSGYMENCCTIGDKVNKRIYHVTI